MAQRDFTAFYQIEDAADKMMTALEQQFCDDTFWFDVISSEINAWVSWRCAELRAKNIDKSLF